MLHPIKVIDVELSRSIPEVADLEGYKRLQGLVRLNGVPLGYVDAPVSLGRCTAATLGQCILDQCGEAIVTELVRNGLTVSDRAGNLTLEALIGLTPICNFGTHPLVTVAVCTRDRPDDIRRCLEAICQLDYAPLDILVVDNAPQTGATQQLIRTDYAHVRYVKEPRPGLDWARNRAILEAKGEIIAYTDDDVIVDSRWVTQLVDVFETSPDVMAVTGLVVPYELETKSQVLFEAYGGFGKGFRRKDYHFPSKVVPWWVCGAGQFGTGANMAYRCSVFSQIGFFDPGLDVGTVTNGGGDLEMFFRVLREGQRLTYEPRAIVRHRHRRSYAKLKSQLTNNGIGLYSYLVRSLQAYPDSWMPLLKLALYWFIYWNLRRAWIAFKHPTRIPSELVWGEFWGSLAGLWRYPQARGQVKQVIRQFGSQAAEIEAFNQAHHSEWEWSQAVTRYDGASIQRKEQSVAIRQLHLEKPLEPIENVLAYPTVRIFVTWRAELLGHVDIENRFQIIKVPTLVDSLLVHLQSAIAVRLLDLEPEDDPSFTVSRWLKEYYGISGGDRPTALPDSVKVTINLATYDRPDDLRNCLKCLQAQQTRREVEIVVVDNHPVSKLTPPVVAEFPGIKLVYEPRQGLAYARNAGFVASTGEIVIATDDDVTVPPDWLEKLLAPFARADVGIVTGNVLPLQLETPSQQFFEQYGGLGKGYAPFNVGLDWFESSPRYAMHTWELGATANAAFRASILSNPDVGLMDEALGPGMPSGVGEDTYLFYKAIKAGYSLAYAPSAYVWHRHRQDTAALRRQLYGYSKGHVSYNMTTWLRDGDWRGLYQILIGLSIYHVRRIALWLFRKSTYPISLILLEIWGNFAGPWSLWRSRCRVKQRGKSHPYISPEQRSKETGSDPKSLSKPSLMTKIH